MNTREIALARQACSVQDYARCIPRRSRKQIVLAQHMIVGLPLQPAVQPFEYGIELLTEELRRYALVRSIQDAYPQQVDVVWHAAIDWTTQSITAHRVGKYLAKLVVEDWNQPTCLAVLDCH